MSGHSPCSGTGGVSNRSSYGGAGRGERRPHLHQVPSERQSLRRLQLPESPPEGHRVVPLSNQHVQRGVARGELRQGLLRGCRAAAAAAARGKRAVKRELRCSLGRGRRLVQQQLEQGGQVPLIRHNALCQDQQQLLVPA